MTIQVTAGQVEALKGVQSGAQVTTVVLEATLSDELKLVSVHGSQVEVVGVQPPQLIRVHGSQVESVQVEAPGPARVHGSQVEVLYPMPPALTPVAVAGMTIEVLRGIPDKKRRPPTNVVAN